MKPIAKRSLASLLLMAPANIALAQPAASPSRAGSASSSGLRTSIGKISVIQGRPPEIAIQIILENIANNKIYFVTTGAIRASLSNGQELRLRAITGAAFCELASPTQEQLNNACIERFGEDLNSYSSIDPGERLDISVRYLTGRLGRESPPLDLGESISFRLIMITRASRAAPGSFAAQRDPRATTTPQVTTLNFSLIPLTAN